MKNLQEIWNYKDELEVRELHCGSSTVLVEIED
jgi:hypothetical protein